MNTTADNQHGRPLAVPLSDQLGPPTLTMRWHWHSDTEGEWEWLHSVRPPAGAKEGSELRLYSAAHLEAAVAEERERRQAESTELRTLLLRYRLEVPLGHQPYMLAHLVDAALGRA